MTWTGRGQTRTPGPWQSWSLALLGRQWGYWAVDGVGDAMNEAGKGTKAEATRVLTQSVCWCSQLGCSFAYSFTVARGREAAGV